MPIEKAAPTALGRCEAMVEVCGGMASGLDPMTLCRPPEIGSSLDAAKLSSMSQFGVNPGICRARWSWKALARYWRKRSEEHTSELQSLMRITYAVICLKQKT